MDLATALQTVTDGVKQYMNALSPSERDAFNVGARATHFEEAVAQGDFARASAHASALGTMMQKKGYVIHVSGGRVTGTTPVHPVTLSPEQKRDIIMSSTPIPGVVIAKVLGATWPIAGVTGMLTAPVVMYVGAKIASHVGTLLALREQAKKAPPPPPAHPVHLMPVHLRPPAPAPRPPVHIRLVAPLVPGAPVAPVAPVAVAQPTPAPAPTPSPGAPGGGNGGPPGGNGNGGGDGGDGDGGAAPGPGNGNGGAAAPSGNGNGNGGNGGNGGGVPLPQAPPPPPPPAPMPAPAPAADPTPLAQQVVDDMATGADPTADVTAFQQAVGLPVSGVVDAATQAAIAQLGITGPSPAAQAQLQAQSQASGYGGDLVQAAIATAAMTGVTGTLGPRGR